MPKAIQTSKFVKTPYKKGRGPRCFSLESQRREFWPTLFHDIIKWVGQTTLSARKNLAKVLNLSRKSLRQRGSFIIKHEPSLKRLPARGLFSVNKKVDWKWVLIAGLVGFIIHSQTTHALPETGLNPKAPVMAQKVSESKLKEQPLVEAAPVPSDQDKASVSQPVASEGCHYGELLNAIFQKESGANCNPGAMNPGGCIGLGQDCNGWLITGRLDSPVCGANWATDTECQTRYWNWYAVKIYGSLENAYNFRMSHNYW